MARPREYNPEQVLDSAMQTFWADGYERTSIRDLAKACKFTTRSMYDAYPNKDVFFEAALDHYQQKILSPIIGILEKGRGFSALAEFVAHLGQWSTAAGCLFLNTSANRHLVRAQAVEKIDRYLARLRRAIFEKLEEERTRGNFRGDSELRADQVIACLMGFIQSLRAGVPIRQASAALAQVVVDIRKD